MANEREHARIKGSTSDFAKVTLLNTKVFCHDCFLQFQG